jgi:hypothetical protein
MERFFRSLFRTLVTSQVSESAILALLSCSITGFESGMNLSGALFVVVTERRINKGHSHGSNHSAQLGLYG